MTSKTKQQNKIPKLRFPGFSEEWEEKTLGEVATFLKGKGISKNDIVENGKNKCIRYGELYTEYKEIIDEVKSQTNISKNNTVLSEENDLLIPSSGETPIDIATTSCIHQEGVFIGGDINILRLKNSCGDFFAYYLSNSKRRDIARLAQGHSVVHLYANHFKNLKMNIPQKEEQEKIAGFLGGVDKWIENLKKQKEELEKYKKGIMQKIFPAKGEKVPQIRFKDDNSKDFPEWEEKRLGEVIEEMNEKTTVNNQYPILSSSKSGIYLQSEYFNKQTASNNTIGYKIIKRGEFTYRSMSDTGNFTFNIQNLIDIGIVSPAYPVFKVQYEKAEPMFLFYYLNCTSDIKRQILKLKQGGTRFALNFNKFQKFKINTSILPEQQKIASFLSAINKKIELFEAQIQKMQEWKRGLIQGLFV